MQEKILGRQTSITEESVKAALSVVIDPDLGKDIVSLGFVRNVVISGQDLKLDQPHDTGLSSQRRYESSGRKRVEETSECRKYLNQHDRYDTRPSSAGR